MTGPLTPEERGRAIEAYHKVFYYETMWRRVHWRGVRVLKCPLDLWIYQEIIHDTRPDLIIECGTANGGSAVYMADMCATFGAGEVVTIDIEPRENMPTHERVTFLRGSSLDDGILSDVRARAARAERVMVVLDSLHERDHVLAELRAYHALVTPGCYLIVEDSNINGHPVVTDFEPDQGPGPYEAIETFMAESDRFEIDRNCERFGVTFNPTGYLRCVR